ncbi:MAG: S8 family serine peptidase [Caldilineaceae bacterium]|nr:S8 family serine peptidase [Caldilineaceae bacterium]
MYKRLLLLVLIGVLLFVPSAAAQEDSSALASLIYLQRATFDPLAAEQGRQHPSASAESASPYYLVQFSGPVDAVWVEQIGKLGGDVLGYVPDNAHVVRMRPAVVDRVASLPSVRWVGPYLDEYKIAPTLDNVISARSNQRVDAYIVSFPGEDAAALATAIEATGASITQMAETTLGPLFQIEAAAGALDQIKALDGVSWIEQALPLTVDNAEGRQIMGAHQVWQNYGYFGKDQIIAISDSGMSVQGNLGADFDGRLVRAFAPSEMNLASATCRAKTTWTDLNGHGTHVAGSVLGSGARSGSNAANHSYTNSHAGVAPEAKFVFMALNTDGSTGIQCVDLNGDFIARGYTEGARISTNSWGGNDQGAYTLLSGIVDDYLWKNKDYFVLFAAGNAGPGPGTIGAPGTAKNILTVGATENNRPSLGQANADNPNEMANFSSRGPTKDGRIKPEVVAPGTWILSNRAAQAQGTFWGTFNADYAYMGGTSMATPLTAGGAALVREWLAKQRNISSPSAALMKALMIHGTQPLPGASNAPNTQSGWGRVDLKNTLDSQYVLLEDYRQGLTTGQQVSYTVNVVGSAAAGTFIAVEGAAQDAPGTETLTLQGHTVPSSRTASQEQELEGLQILALPGFATPPARASIPTQNDKEGMPALKASTPSLSAPENTSAVQSSGFHPRGAEDLAETQAFLFNLVGGGDFEDPGWTNLWQYVWLGQGVPVRTDNPNLVINGNHSMWLGGTEFDDSIWYPFALPDTIDTANPSYFSFNVGIVNQDLGYDLFCAALVDASGYFIGPYADEGPGCVEQNGLYTYQYTFTPTELANLAGQSGYIVLYTLADGELPHMSAIVDDIIFAIDFPNPTLDATPNAGPAGTTFLLTGQYNQPWGEVAICAGTCANQNNLLGVVYADAVGDLAAYLPTPTDLVSGTYTLQSRDFYARTANTSITIGASSQPTVTVSPASGQPGTAFRFSGEGFLPSENTIAVTVNGNSIGSISSNDEGKIAFTLNTVSNTPTGSYTVRVTDRANNSAQRNFTISAPPASGASLVVTPTSAIAGATFVFNGANFTPTVAVQLSLDGQAVGQVTAAADGTFQVTLETSANTQPGTYVLQAAQAQRNATAQFTILGSGDGGGGGTPQTGGGLYITLVWTDPPAQQSAAKTLVNNLDLTVIGPGGTFRGNGGSSADATNTVETVRLPNPAAGQYTVIVSASSVNGAFGAQPFALVGSTRQNFGANTADVNMQQEKIYLPAVTR